MGSGRVLGGPLLPRPPRARSGHGLAARAAARQARRCSRSTGAGPPRPSPSDGDEVHDLLRERLAAGTRSRVASPATGSIASTAMAAERIVIVGAGPALPAPDPHLEAVVVVPARDEAERIGACLRALAEQRGVSEDAYEVVVVLDGCRDAHPRARARCRHEPPAAAVAPGRAERAERRGTRQARRHGPRLRASARGRPRRRV